MQILALKFLGFSLEEIKHCLQIGPTVLQESLSLQQAMMQEKRTQLDNIIQAIAETEQLLQPHSHCSPVICFHPIDLDLPLRHLLTFHKSTGMLNTDKIKYTDPR